MSDEFNEKVNLLQTQIQTGRYETNIRVAFERYKTHNFPGAATEEAMKSVAYLAQEHGHTFRMNVWMTVTHLDRELEFIIVRRFLEGFFDAMYPNENMGHVSCEMIAHALIAGCLTKYGSRVYRVTVDEDDNHGADVTYTPLGKLPLF